MCGSFYCTRRTEEHPASGRPPPGQTHLNPSSKERPLRKNIEFIALCNKGTTSVGPPRKRQIIRALAPANIPTPFADCWPMPRTGAKAPVFLLPMCGPTEVVPFYKIDHGSRSGRFTCVYPEAKGQRTMGSVTGGRIHICLTVDGNLLLPLPKKCAVQFRADQHAERSDVEPD